MSRNSSSSTMSSPSAASVWDKERIAGQQHALSSNTNIRVVKTKEVQQDNIEPHQEHNNMRTQGINPRDNSKSRRGKKKRKKHPQPPHDLPLLLPQ